MDKVSVQYFDTALQFREAINIAIAMFAFVLCLLLGRYVVIEVSQNGYRNTGWPVKLSCGLFFMFAGEFLRSSTIWEVLHYEGSTGTYLSNVVPLLLSLFLIILGALCVIRVMTPVKWGNSVWVGSLVVVLGLIAVSRFL